MQHNIALKCLTGCLNYIHLITLGLFFWLCPCLSFVTIFSAELSFSCIYMTAREIIWDWTSCSASTFWIWFFQINLDCYILGVHSSPVSLYFTCKKVTKVTNVCTLYCCRISSGLLCCLLELLPTSLPPQCASSGYFQSEGWLNHSLFSVSLSGRSNPLHLANHHSLFALSLHLPEATYPR